MDISSLAQYLPTTVYGLAAVLIIVAGYGLRDMNKAHKEQSGRLIELLERKDDNYSSFVNSENHQKTEMIAKSVAAIVQSTEVMKSVQASIESNTDTVKELLTAALRDKS